MSNPRARLDRAIAQFVGAFEVVFDEDWEYSLDHLKANHREIVGEGTFLNPHTPHHGVNWGARAALLDAHSRLLEAMKECSLKPDIPVRDDWFNYDWAE